MDTSWETQEQVLGHRRTGRDKTATGRREGWRKKSHLPRRSGHKALFCKDFGAKPESNPSASSRPPTQSLIPGHWESLWSLVLRRTLSETLETLWVVVGSGEILTSIWDFRYFYPFTPESDQCQNSPTASQEIWHHTVWGTWLFIAYSDEKWLYYKLSLHHSYNRIFKGWEYTLFELRSERVNLQMCPTTVLFGILAFMWQIFKQFANVSSVLMMKILSMWMIAWTSSVKGSWLRTMILSKGMHRKVERNGGLFANFGWMWVSSQAFLRHTLISWVITYSILWKVDIVTRGEWR